MSQTPTASIVRSAGGGPRGFRADLEGIRGIALLVILATHLVEWPTGGFVALDLFFVLSGFLITGLLVKEYEKTGRIQLWRFSRRRIRRLAPAATATILVTVAASFLLFPLTRATAVAQDGLWALLLSANWRFVLTDTDYFATWAPQSPLLHFWSLGVEEQFYLLWPLLISGAFALAVALRRRRRRAGRPRAGGWASSPRTVPFLVIAGITLASFAWSLVQAPLSPEVSYLSTLTRVWELGLGALLFFGVPLWSRIPFLGRAALAWSGLAALLASAVILDAQTPYPGVAALLPVLASAAIVVSGVGGPAAFGIATNPAARYLGRISYSMYLWHWPVFVMLGTVFGRSSPTYLIGAVPLAALLAVLSFHLLEDPVRRSQWLEPRPPSRGDAWHRFERRSRHVAALSVSAMAALVAAVIAIPQLLPAGPEAPRATPSPEAGRTSSAAPSGPEDARSGGAGGAAGTEGESADPGSEGPQAEVVAALQAEQWPDDVVRRLEAGEAGPERLLADACLDVRPETEADCVVGDESLPRTAVLLGDSVALSWMPGLGPALNEQGYRVHLLGHSQCPFADVSVTGSPDADADSVRPGYPEVCDDHREWSQQRTVELAPDLVVAADAEAEMQMLLTPDDVSGDAEYWREGVVSSVEALGGADVVMLSSPPQAANLGECFTRVSRVEDCTERIADQWRDQHRASVEAAERLDGALRVVDTREWFCSPDGWCPPFAADRVIRADRQHLSADYAEYLTPRLATILTESR